MRETICPVANQDMGVSTECMSVILAGRRRSRCQKPLKADRAVFHCRKKPRMPAVTMHDVPPQSVHCTSELKLFPVINPAFCTTGTKTPQQRVPPMSML